MSKVQDTFEVRENENENIKKGAKSLWLSQNSFQMNILQQLLILAISVI